MHQFSQRMKWERVRSILAKLLGCFLLLAAILKAHGLFTDPYGQENFLSPLWLQFLSIEVELLLGLWLLSGMRPRLAWWVTLSFFAILAGMSFLLAWQGQASCGCFGKVEVNPWYTFALDIVIVAIMLPLSFTNLTSRAASAPGGITQLFNPIFQITLITTLLLSILALGFTLITGDPWAALARLRGETLAVIPAVTQLGEGTAGESRTFQVQLRNYSDKPIKVVGGTTSCACIATQDLPITIPAGGAESINVKITFSGSPGKFAHRYVLYSDIDERMTIARFSGSTVPSTQKVGPGVKGNESISNTSNNRQPDSQIEKPKLSDKGGLVP